MKLPKKDNRNLSYLYNFTINILTLSTGYGYLLLSSLFLKYGANWKDAFNFLTLVVDQCSVQIIKCIYISPGKQVRLIHYLPYSFGKAF